VKPSDEIARDLSALLRGQVRFCHHDRMLYSTDASIYQVKPIGVIVPADADDVAATLRYCAERHIAVLPRGGGTSLAGQCTNEAVVIDLSALCRRVLSVDSEARTARVEAGTTIDALNQHLSDSRTGLFYAVDPATVSQAAIGGTIGNNAAGARSIRYGRTSENLAGVDVLLSDGLRVVLEPGAGRRDAIALQLARGVADTSLRHADDIRKRFPKTIRRNAGYGLDLMLAQLDRGVKVEDLDLSSLICGSEGTLAVVVTARLKLLPLPLARALAIVSFDSVEDAVDATNAIIATKPTAVELIDRVVLDAARGNLATAPLLELLPELDGNAPNAVVYVEYTAERSFAEIDEGFTSLSHALTRTRHSIAHYRDAESLNRAWTLRKSGEPLLHAISSGRKPHTFVEDNAIPLENLPRFVREFRRIVAAHGTTAAYWAHVSVGLLHVRPLVDVRDERDRAMMRQIAVEVADLARDCGGVMSGEHGDGRLRGPLLERFFGPRLVGAFAEVKRLFDPANILNPGDIVSAGPVESITQRLRVLPDPGLAGAVRVPEADTYFTYDDQHGFDGAVEMCNGAGFCRKTTGGTMCPSYRATLDERHSTRGRANALRLAITGQLSPDDRPAWNDSETMATLDLCLSCKACKTECPSNVDVARLKAEYTGQRFRPGGAPLGARVFGNVRTLNRIGSLAPDLANGLAELPPVRAVINRVLGLAPRRTLPPFARSLHSWFDARESSSSTATQPIVILYADCFTTYNEPHVGRAAVRVLEALGYEVRFPRVGCCGRAMISTGVMDDAIRTINRTAEQLMAAARDTRVHGIVVCEPSCLSAIKDDWIHLKLATPLDQRRRLAEMSWLVEDFVERLAPRFRPTSRQVILHGHCHQKALWGDQTSARALRRVVDAERLTVLPSGCCGMAGSFGYAAHRYELSMRIGELSVFPAIREAEPDAIIVAPGTSCRHQIRDGTGRQAVHPIELLDQARKMY
jgi:FAD/FMN-containing dehydrogenase/Fe-S oxidoreductase